MIKKTKKRRVKENERKRRKAKEEVKKMED